MVDPQKASSRIRMTTVGREVGSAKPQGSLYEIELYLRVKIQIIALGTFIGREWCSGTLFSTYLSSGKGEIADYLATYF